MLKIKDNVDLKEKLEEFIKELEYGIEFSKNEEASRWEKQYGLCLETVLKLMQDIGLVEDEIETEEKGD